MFSSNSPSLADIAAVTDNKSNGMGENWWILILLFFIFGGNFGSNNRNNGGCCQQPVGCTEFNAGMNNQAIMAALGNLNEKVCNNEYRGLEQNTHTTQVISQLGFDLSKQLSDCCCENRLAVTKLENKMDRDACDIQNDMFKLGQAIMKNDNDNYRALMDKIVSLQIEQKDQKIAEQNATIQALNLASSQKDQTNELIKAYVELAGLLPKASYLTPNPYPYGIKPQATAK